MVAIATKALSLNSIIQFEEEILPFRHDHLRRKPKIGIVGQPGEGKSISFGYILLNQFLIWMEPVWSNLPVKYTYNVPEDIANEYGLHAGKATFESSPLNKFKMIRMDGTYRMGGIGLDEINIEFADAMKTTSNVNFYFDQADQQLRKDGNGLVYTTIDEMWVDPRLRSITDIFIKCEDTALSPEGLASKKQEGIDIKWRIFPMTRMFNGHSWYEDHVFYTCIFHARDYWGVIDTLHKQATGKKYAVDVFQGSDSYQLDNPEATNQMAAVEYSKWGWLYQKVKELRDMGVSRVEPERMWEYLHQFCDINISELGKQLSLMGVRRTGDMRHKGDFIIDGFSLESPLNTEKELVLGGGRGGRAA